MSPPIKKLLNVGNAFVKAGADAARELADNPTELALDIFESKVIPEAAVADFSRLYAKHLFTRLEKHWND